MIVKMKRITLLCLENERAAALGKLRDLGIVHVDREKRVESESVSVLEQSLTELTKVYNALSGSRNVPQKSTPLSGRSVLKQASELLALQASLEKERENLKREIDVLLPWGDFQPGLVSLLAENGVSVLFCMTYKDEYDQLEIPENMTKVLVNAIRNERYFLLISQEKPDAAQYPTVSLPAASLTELREKLSSVGDRLAEIAGKLTALAAHLGELKEYFDELNAEYEFVSNRDGMDSDGAIAYLSGYIPADCLEKLTAAAHENGWGLTADDPDAADLRVPTCIRKPGWLKIIDPLFDFIGITPGYRENDVSLFFLIAFPVFFGMLIGDAAYGALFIVTALLCKYLLRKKPAARMPLNLLILLSSFSVIWGLLTGSCLGLPREVLPRFLQGLDFLADPAKSPAASALANKLGIDPSEMSDKFTQWFCFLLAALHLSAARLFKYLTDFRNWRSLGNIGWACLIWGNFFTAVNLIVFPGTFPKWTGICLYGIGLLLIVVTITAEAALNLPFSVVGSFVDVLSYIRLFAVGLSGVYVASCFNSMGMMVLDSMPKSLFVIGLIGLILVAMAGHILDIILGFMGVLVHAIRLNTLEFSNHIEMQWTGIPYRPFAKKNK